MELVDLDADVEDAVDTTVDVDDVKVELAHVVELDVDVDDVLGEGVDVDGADVMWRMRLARMSSMPESSIP